MSSAFPLSVLDLATVVEGATDNQALQRSVALAQHAESLGYLRFWTAEHHNMPSIASSAPDLIAMRIADCTRRIRVGSGGVMLPNHAPLTVAERYLTLEAFHPHRVDLGVGRAPGTDGLTARALRRSDEPGYAQQLAELDAFLNRAFPADHPYARIEAVPRSQTRPALIVLGSSYASAQLAAARGYAFAFAGHFSPDLAASAMRLYREQFVPGALARPHAILALSVIAAETRERADWIARATLLAYVRFVRGQGGRVPSPEEAANYPWSSTELATAQTYAATQVIGDGADVGQRLVTMGREAGADEIMVTATIHDFEDHKRSLAIIAEAVSR